MSIPQQVTKPRIVLVEDNPGDVELLRMALEDANVDCEMTVISDGEEALRFLGQFETGAAERLPDLMILDLNLPKSDGLEVLECTRASGQFASVPVIVLTSSSSPRETAKLQMLGVCRHLTKPGELEAFMELGPTIKAILKEYGKT